MNVIEKSVSNVLINELNKLHLEILPHFNSGNKLINHKLLYCNKWIENKYSYLVDLLKNESPENIINQTVHRIALPHQKSRRFRYETKIIS